MFIKFRMSATLAVSLSLVSTGLSAAQETRQPIDIPAQSLIAAIGELGVETGFQVSADNTLVADKRSSAVSGRMTPGEALMRMLAGTNLSFRSLGADGAVITVAQTPNADERPLVMDEIIVEGEKVFRTLREVPASTVVIPGDVAEAPQNQTVNDVIQGIPNVFAPESFNLPAIRGIDGSAGQIGGAALTTGAQPRVPIIVDGVPRPLTIGSTPSVNTPWDINAVEVARGPQGTTTGRNALAGAIRINTNDPTFEFETAVRANYFNQDGTVGGAFLLNVPIIEDQVALRFTAEASEGSTFVEVIDPFLTPADASEAEEEKYRRFRGKLLIAPDAIPGLEIVASVDRTAAQRQFAPGLVDAPGSQTLDDFSFITSIDVNEQVVYSGRVNYEFSDRLEFEAQASFLDNTFQIPNVTPLFDFEQTTETIFVEGLARINDVGPISKGVFGFSFENQADEGVNTVGFFPFGLDADITNYGIFTELEFSLTEKLTFIAGGRVEIDRRDRLVTFGGVGADTSVDEVAFIPKAGFRYDLNESIVLGYGFADGFRPGGVDFDIFDPVNGVVEFDSERLRQHEIYARTSWLDDRLTINGSAFFYTLDDPQVGGAAIAGVDLFGNVPRARGYGLEIDGAYELVEGLNLSLGLGLLRTRITDAGSVVPQFEGAELPRAPNITANGGLSYVSEFGLDASIDARFVGSTTTFLGEATVDNYVVLDLAAGYEFELGDRVSGRIDAFINNATDNAFVTETFGTNLLVGRPRTFGIAATMRF